MQGGQINSDKEAGVACCSHNFLLRRISLDTPSPSVQVDFSPAPATSAAHPAPPSGTHRFSHPSFNTDHLYFTPAFILDADREKYQTNASCYFSLHQSKKQELQTEKEELWVPKPSKASSFCCICRTMFDDYLTHVNIPKHQECLRKSEFSSSITELCRIFNKVQVEEQPKKGAKKQTKKIQKAEKPRRAKKDVDTACNSNSMKLQFSLEGKTKETLV